MGTAVVAARNPATDATLVEAARAGSRQAFGTLVDRYDNLVFSVAYAQTGRFALSQDIAQETFMEAWRDLRQLREPERFRGWICRIVHRVGGRMDRRENRLVSAPFDDFDVSQWFGGDRPAPDRAAGPSPLDQMIDRETGEQVWCALAKLPEAYRTPIVLYYQAGRSIENVADALDLSLRNVKERLYRGRRMLRRMLKARVPAMIEAALSRQRARPRLRAGVIATISVGVGGGVSPAKGESTMPRAIGAPLTRMIAIGTVAMASVGAWYVTDAVPVPHRPSRPMATKGATTLPPPRLDFRVANGVARRATAESPPLVVRAPRRIFGLELDDAQEPTSLVAGKIALAGSASGRGRVIDAEINVLPSGTYVSLGFAADGGLFRYARSHVLGFDYRLARRANLFIQMTSPHGTHKIYLGPVGPSDWTHVDVPLADHQTATGGNGMDEGDFIVGFYIGAPYEPGQALQVINVQVLESGG